MWIVLWVGEWANEWVRLEWEQGETAKGWGARHEVWNWMVKDITRRAQPLRLLATQIEEMMDEA